MSPALIPIVTAFAASVAPAVAAPAPATASPVIETQSNACQPRRDHDILVCGRRSETYRLDPNVMEAGAEAQTNSRSESFPVPAAQAACSNQPMGCGVSVDSLDLANVAIVAGTMGLRAAKGEDWVSALRTGDPDEYQLYREAKQRREAQSAERAAAEVRTKARKKRRDVAATAER